MFLLVMVVLHKTSDREIPDQYVQTSILNHHAQFALKNFE